MSSRMIDALILDKFAEALTAIHAEPPPEKSSVLLAITCDRQTEDGRCGKHVALAFPWRRGSRRWYCRKHGGPGPKR